MLTRKKCQKFLNDSSDSFLFLFLFVIFFLWPAKQIKCVAGEAGGGKVREESTGNTPSMGQVQVLTMPHVVPRLLQRYFCALIALNRQILQPGTQRGEPLPTPRPLPLPLRLPLPLPVLLPLPLPLAPSLSESLNR